MTSHAIRVQLPGGAVYAPALLEAATKTGSRSGHPAKIAKALDELVKLSLDVLNSGKSSMITLEMTVLEDGIAAKLTGKGCVKPTKKLVTKLEGRASKRADEFAVKALKTSHTISFVV